MAEPQFLLPMMGREFQPMNANYGLFPALARPRRGREKKLALAERALRDFDAWRAAEGLEAPPASAERDDATAVEA